MSHGHILRSVARLTLSLLPVAALAFGCTEKGRSLVLIDLTNDGTALLPFKSSLLSAVEPLAHDVPIQPVALDYLHAAEIAWFGDEPGMANVNRILSRPGRVELTIKFLEPLAGEALANRKTMTAAAQAAIARALGR